MIEIQDHTIEESIIQKNGWVLDLGCINFKFTNELLKYSDNVIGIDANPSITNDNPKIKFENYALISDSFNKDHVNYYIYIMINMVIHY